MRTGRPNKGIHHVDDLEGDEFTKDRLRLIFETNLQSCKDHNLITEGKRGSYDRSWNGTHSVRSQASHRRG